MPRTALSQDENSTHFTVPPLPQKNTHTTHIATLDVELHPGNRIPTLIHPLRDHHHQTTLPAISHTPPHTPPATTMPLPKQQKKQKHTHKPPMYPGSSPQKTQASFIARLQSGKPCPVSTHTETRGTQRRYHLTVELRKRVSLRARKALVRQRAKCVNSLTHSFNLSLINRSGMPLPA